MIVTISSVRLYDCYNQFPRYVRLYDYLKESTKKFRCLFFRICENIGFIAYTKRSDLNFHIKEHSPRQFITIALNSLAPISHNRSDQNFHDKEYYPRQFITISLNSLAPISHNLLKHWFYCIHEGLGS